MHFDTLNLTPYLLFGVILRLWLFYVPQIHIFLNKLPETSTPLTSWNRVVEGVAIEKHAQSLYDGDSYHGSTLLLLFASSLQDFPVYVVNMLFVICDFVSAIALYRFAARFLRHELMSQSACVENFAAKTNAIWLKKHHVENAPFVISLIYFFNPLVIANCVSKSTLTFNNMFICLFLNEAVSGNLVLMTLFLAVSSYESFYPFQLIIPAALCYYKYKKISSSFTTCLMRTLICGIAWLFFLFLVAYLHKNSLDVVLHHFKFLLNAPDQTPNIGVFWYFFTEVFNHFQPFFIFVFQMNVVVYSIPMSIKLRSHPVLLIFILLAIISTFKSYPSFGDAGLWLSIIPLWSHTFKYLRFPIVAFVMLVCSAILCPVMWHMWINARSANANFFFAATLAYSTSQVFIMTNVFLAYLKWHFHLKHGLQPVLPDTKEKAEIRLLN